MKTIRIPLGKTTPFQIIPKSKNEPTEQVERIGVSAKRAAEMIDVCERTIWNLAKEGKIRAIRIGKRVIISVKSLREFVDGATKIALDLDLDKPQCTGQVPRTIWDIAQPKTTLQSVLDSKVTGIEQIA